MASVSEYKQAWLRVGKDVVRATVGYGSVAIPSHASNTPRLYLNLDTGYHNRVGGVNRFMQQFRKGLVERHIGITHRTPAGCDAALVISNSWGPSFMRLCHLLKVPSVLRVDGFYHPRVFGEDGAQYRLTRYLAGINARLRQDLATFDHVVYQSAFSKQQADMHIFERTHNYSIISNGTDTGYLAPTVKQLTAQPHIISVGRHAPAQITLAFAAFEQARAQHACRLSIVGPLQRGAEQTWADCHARSPFAQDITYQGVVGYADLPRVLGEADMFVHFKVGDSCPNAVLEALSCGLPVICPAWGGTKELVVDAGIAVPAPDWSYGSELAEGMAAALLKIMDDLPTYAQRARERAVSAHDQHLMVERYLDLLVGDERP